MHHRSGGLFILLLVVMLPLVFAGCTSSTATGSSGQTSIPVATPTIAPVITMPNATAIIVTPKMSASPAPRNTTTAGITAGDLNARITDARNKLNNLIDSDVADIVIVRPTPQQSCEIKRVRELGYQIDTLTGESVFAKGGYWSIDSSLFSHTMIGDRDYVIVHTHPKTWKKCPGSSTFSPNTFSIGDLEAAESLKRTGLHVRQLIAVSEGRDFRIWPQTKDDWKSPAEIRSAIKRVETRLEQKFSYYDPVLDHEIFDVDNLMPYLARELNYTYTINNNVIT